MKLHFLTRKEWLISHIFIWAGLILLSVWLSYYLGTHQAIGLLIGGIWCIIGGFCWIAAYSLRKLPIKKEEGN
jgi:positive regulator of sigma E activity